MDSVPSGARGGAGLERFGDVNFLVSRAVFLVVLLYGGFRVCAFRHPIAVVSFFFFNDTATTEIYTLSLHDALPISINWSTIRWRGPSDPNRSRSFSSPRTSSGTSSSRSTTCRGRGSRWSFAHQVHTGEIGRAHLCTPVTIRSRMPASAFKKKKSEIV